MSTRPVRQPSIDEETRQLLEKRLSQRPAKNELVERDILKGGDPTLDEESRHQLEKRLNERPAKNELVERNILKDDKGMAPSLIAAKERLMRSQLEDKLDHALQQRPTPAELVKGGILNDGEAPPNSV